MSSLLLIGGGGHCHACIDVIESTNAYQIEGVVLPTVCSKQVMGYPVVGSDDDLPRLLRSSYSALVTVGQIKTATTRIRLFNLIKQLGAELPVIVSPKSYCSKHSNIGEGSIIMHGATVNACARIGNNCIVNSHALVEHDVTIGDHCHISTGVQVNGNVTIGKGSFVGSGAIIKEGVILGENVIIGAGEIILHNVANGRMVKNVAS
jgi:sugar O-acyltransferase (sialic acid O-acetyltransferase NeuD family)